MDWEKNQWLLCVFLFKKISHSSDEILIELFRASISRPFMHLFIKLDFSFNCIYSFSKLEDKWHFPLHTWRLMKYWSVSCIIRFKMHLNRYLSADKQQDCKIFLDNYLVIVYIRFSHEKTAFISGHLILSVHFFS